MPPQQPLGVMMMPLENRREAILRLALTAEEQNYDALFLPETWAYDITVLLAEIAVRTKNIKLGTGILSVWGRSAATIAMAASTLDTISDGRFILGLGSSTKQLAEGLHDVPYEMPYRKLRQTVSQVSALVKGNRIPLADQLEARPLRLNLSEFSEIPLFLAASASKSIKIAGELCDGWLPFLIPRDSLKEGIALLHEGADLAGIPGPEKQVYPIIPTVIAEETEKAREGAAWVVVFYLNKMGPIYRNALKRYGYQKQVEAILEANKGNNSAVVPPEGEVLLEQLTIYGTLQEVKEKIPAWYASGASMPCLMINPDLSLDEISYSLEAIR
jgi:alkanesulfonate monooxygenase SsuD/methylene tetrahydromethanopterin reductase-like flavin-dependent oxidoreductase (luciferase family)